MVFLVVCLGRLTEYGIETKNRKQEEEEEAADDDDDDDGDKNAKKTFTRCKFLANSCR